MTKRTCYLRDVSIVPAEFYFGKAGRGKFVAYGYMAKDDAQRHFYSDDRIRTSLIVNIDIQNGVIETMNTFYKIMPYTVDPEPRSFE